MTANISQVTDKNIPPSPETLSLLYIWTLPGALKNRSILRHTLNVPTFHHSRGQGSLQASEEGRAGISPFLNQEGASPLKWCRPSGDVILASSWQGTDVALKQIPTPGEASGDVEPAVMALLLWKQNAPSSGRTLGLRSQGTEGLPRKSVRAQKKTRNCASLCVLGSIKAPIIPCRVEGHKTNQLPTQRPGGREELLGLIFHPDPLSVSSSWH